MKKISKPQTLSDMMWLMIVVILLLFGIAFSVVTMALTQKARREYEITECENIINSMTDSIEADISNYQDISRMIMLNASVVKYLRADTADVFNKGDAMDGVMSVLNVCTGMDSVIIFRNDYQYFCTGRAVYDLDFDIMLQDDWLHVINDKRGGATLSINGNGAVHRSDEAPIVTIGRAIYDINSQKQTGILLMNLSVNMFSRIARAQKNNDVCIMARDGTFLAGSEKLMELYREDMLSSGEIVHQSARIDRESCMAAMYAIDNSPFVLLCTSKGKPDVIPMNVISVLAVLLVMFLLCVLFSGIMITKNVTNPILNLASAIEETQNSGWLKRIEVEAPNNEIGILTKSYNSMIAYLNDLFNRLLENEKTVQRAEVHVLYEQIKPHFLYNSLETIGCMAMEAGADDVQDALETLGSFYRNFLSKGQREIPLRRELCIIKDYLSLQKLRYGNILSDEYDISEETLDCLIPKLILQPLVENSINHGIRLKGEDGVIRVRSWLEDDLLHISVRDTGVGMSQELIDSVLSGTNTVSPDELQGTHGFGLRGTIERIRYYCNSDDVVQIRSELGEYTEIEITVPKMKKEESDNVQSNAH